MVKVFEMTGVGALKFEAEGEYPSASSNREPRHKCPNCDGPTSSVGNSISISKTYREVTYECRNINCRMRFVAGIEALRIIVPPLQIEREVNLPHSRYRRTPPDPPAQLP
jgi:hypothetical protein